MSMQGIAWARRAAPQPVPGDVSSPRHWLQLDDESGGGGGTVPGATGVANTSGTTAAHSAGSAAATQPRQQHSSKSAKEQAAPPPLQVRPLPQEYHLRQWERMRNAGARPARVHRSSVRPTSPEGHMPLAVVAPAASTTPKACAEGEVMSPHKGLLLQRVMMRKPAAPPPAPPLPVQLPVKPPPQLLQPLSQRVEPPQPVIIPERQSEIIIAEQQSEIIAGTRASAVSPKSDADVARAGDVISPPLSPDLHARANCERLVQWYEQAAAAAAAQSPAPSPRPPQRLSGATRCEAPWWPEEGLCLSDPSTAASAASGSPTVRRVITPQQRDRLLQRLLSIRSKRVARLSSVASSVPDGLEPAPLPPTKAAADGSTSPPPGSSPPLQPPGTPPLPAAPAPRWAGGGAAAASSGAASSAAAAAVEQPPWMTSRLQAVGSDLSVITTAASAVPAAAAAASSLAVPPSAGPNGARRLPALDDDSLPPSGVASASSIAASNDDGASSVAIGSALSGAAAITSDAAASDAAAAAALDDDEGSPDVSDLCVVCCSNAKEVVFLHNSSVHRCACRDCAASFRIGGPCPLCSAPVTAIMRPYSATRLVDRARADAQAACEPASAAAATPAA